MKTTTHKCDRFFRATALLCLIAALIICSSPTPAPAQSLPGNINMPPPGSDNSSAKPASASKDTGPWIPSAPLTSDASTNQASGTNATDGIQLSFQGANIDMIVQWLSQTTGKSVLKHPQVQCQLTITSSKKVTQREAINLVYRALALEGYSAIEFSDSILIVPQDKEPRMSPELLGSSQTNVPEGRQRLVKVFSLKHIHAADLRDRISTALSDKAIIYLEEQANQIIITDYNDNIRAVGELIAALDTEEAQEKNMRTFTLKNADAQDVAKQLQDLNQEQSVNARYIMNYTASSDKSSQKIAVVADRRRNAVIVQAPPAQMDSLARMIIELDAPVTDDSLAPRIYPMKYASAADIEDVLNELFLKKQQQRSYWDFFDDSSDNSTPDRDVGRLYGKVRITSEPNSNALIVTANSKENLAAVEEIINQLDKPPEAGDSTLHVGLKFSKAIDVANSINVLFAKNGSPPLRAVAQANQQNAASSQQTQQQPQTQSAQTGFDLATEAKVDGYFPWLGGQPDGNTRSSDNRDTVRPVSDLVGRVRAVADERSNALMISANVHFFPQILKLIAALDAPTAQVLIEARLLEVSSDYLDQLGVRWSPNGAQEFTANDYDNSIIGNVSVQSQRGFGPNTTVNTPSSPTTMAQALTELRSGVLSSSISMDFLVQFLHEKTDATILAEPQLNIRDNETGKLFVGQEVPVPENTQVSSVGSQNTSITYKDVGVVLEVTPHINNSGDVELKIHAESSTVVPGQTVLGGDVFETANFRTDMTAKNGQTLIVGGIIQKQSSNTSRKTPFLGSIPLLKWFVNNKDNSAHEVELMVFLRPKIILTPKDATEVLKEMEDKEPLVKKWQEETYPNQTDK
jgi:general secretion pathway protein D